MNDVLKDHKYIKAITKLSDEIDDRYEFHKQVSPILVEMGNDKEFLGGGTTQFYRYGLFISNMEFIQHSLFLCFRK